MKAKIVRLEESEQGALGVLLLNNEIFCYTLQPDRTDEHFYIPAGEYVCRRFHGVKWPDTFEIIRPATNGIDGHKYLLFHSGNTENDTEGCIIQGTSVGRLKGSRAVLNSVVTFKQFMARMEGIESFPITIVDCY
jgi:hypothetical protein